MVLAISEVLLVPLTLFVDVPAKLPSFASNFVMQTQNLPCTPRARRGPAGSQSLWGPALSL